MDWASIMQGLAGYGNVGEGGLPSDVAPPAPFQARWPTPGMTAETMPTMAQSPISPEIIAKTAASRGIPPPAQDLVPPAPPAPEPFRLHGSTFGPNDPGPELGSALLGNNTTTGGPSVGAPMDIKTPVQQQAEAASTDVSAQSKDKDKTPTFADALKGVKAPAGPELQRLATPAAPKPTGQIKGGELLALLQALNVGGAAAGNYQLPSTLGQALLGRK